MKKLLIAVVTAALSLSACGQPTAYQQPVDQGYAQQQPSQGAFGGHGDAILAGAAGLAAGHYMANRHNRNAVNRYPQTVHVIHSYQPRTVYRTVAPSSHYNYHRPSRSSGFGGYRSRR